MTLPKKVKFSLPAKRQLKEVWRYSSTMWSDAQADHYTSELGQFVIESVERPERWKKLTARHDDVYFIHFRRHVIVFREVGAEILVIAVFHDRMNILARIDDLL